METTETNVTSSDAEDVSAPEHGADTDSTHGVDPEFLAAIVASVEGRPETEGVDPEILEKVCIEAILQDKINDGAWFLENLAMAQAGPLKKGVKEFEIEVARHRIVEDEEELKEVLKSHALWVRSVLDPRKAIGAGRANLAGSDLSHFDLSYCELRGATLAGCNLSGANLEGANLATANLKQADLSGACLRKANLRRANLSGAILIDACLEGVVLSDVQTESAIFSSSGDETPASDQDAGESEDAAIPEGQVAFSEGPDVFQEPS